MQLDDGEDQRQAKQIPQASSPPSLSELLFKSAERVFLSAMPGQATISLILCSFDGTAAMAKLAPDRATRLGRRLLDATGKGLRP